MDAVQAEARVQQRLKRGANPARQASYGRTGHHRELHNTNGGSIRLNNACAFGYVRHQRVLCLDVVMLTGQRTPRSTSTSRAS